jgi:hypothetical protein
MDMQTFNKAQHIREQVTNIEKAMARIKKYSKREKDAPFNDCKETAYTALDFMRAAYEKDFKEL